MGLEDPRVLEMPCGGLSAGDRIRALLARRLTQYESIVSGFFVLGKTEDDAITCGAARAFSMALRARAGASQPGIVICTSKRSVVPFVVPDWVCDADARIVELSYHSRVVSGALNPRINMVVLVSGEQPMPLHAAASVAAAAAPAVDPNAYIFQTKVIFFP